LDLRLAWWEAGLLFLLWAVQFGFSVLPQSQASAIHLGVTMAYLTWCAIEIIRLVARGRLPIAFITFGRLVRAGPASA
jgi:hypothetical protein